MRLPTLPADPPRLWPEFHSPLRSTAVTARVGRVLGIAFGICFVTGLLSHYQYAPWHWLPIPAAPYWGYRLTQGLHVITGIGCIPLLLLKLWSVFHRLFAWPPVRSIAHSLERASVAILVSSAVFQVITGVLNILQFYPWPWGFIRVHYWMSWVVIGSLLLHIAVQLPAIREGLSTSLRAGRPTFEPATSADPTVSDGEAEAEHGQPAAPDSGGLSRRGVLVAGGAGVAVVAATTVGQVIPALQPVALLAPRQPKKGPSGVPVNRTAQAAGVIRKAQSPTYRLTVAGPRMFELTLAELEALPTATAVLPIACVEGWSIQAHWRGPRLLDLVTRAGGSAGSGVAVHSLESGAYSQSSLTGSQLEHALLATHLNGDRLSLDHGYPIRLIAPDRAGVLQTKWLTRIEVNNS